MKKKLIPFLIVSVILFSFLSCESDGNTEVAPTVKDTTVQGKWIFTLSPDKSFKDTTEIKNFRGTDYEEFENSYEVYLYEDKNQNIIGISSPFKFGGKRSGNKIVLDVYDHPENEYISTRELKDMKKISTMNLTIDEFGNLHGNGTYYENSEYEKQIEEEYSVFADKISDLKNALGKTNSIEFVEGTKSFESIACGILGSINSFLISKLSGNIIRPMGGCWFQKNGGGYYLFGETGPGSILPIYTQTVYWPIEWSWCKVRKYSFDVELKGSITAIDAVEWYLKNKPPTNHFHSDLGFASVDAFAQIVNEFYNLFGNFAISLAYDTHTKNISIYVNHEKGNTNQVESHLLVQNIKNAISPHVNGVWLFSGKNIHDSFHLRRSLSGLCSSPLLIIYVVGTANVYYN